MRRRISLKSDTCTEGMYVDAASISVKVGAHYPGRSVGLSRSAGLVSSRVDAMGRQKSAEGIVGPPTGPKA